MDQTGQRLLFVGSRKALAATEVRLLEREGYAVACAATGGEAVERLRAGENPVDLVLVTAEPDGFAAAPEILSVCDVPVVFILLRDDRGLTEEAERLSPYGCVAAGAGLPAWRNAVGLALRLHRAHRELADKEEAVRVNRERFEQIAETIDEVFWMADLEIGHMFYISQGYERVWGRSRESLYREPRSFIDSIHEEDRERVLEDYQRKASGLPFEHEYRIIRPDGSTRWIRDRAFPVQDRNGQVGQYVGVARDITRHRQAEEELRRITRELQLILDTVPASIWFKDRENKILRVNKVAAEMMNMSPADLENRPNEEVAPDWLADKYFRDDLEVIASGRPKTGIEEPYRTAVGELRWALTDKVPWYNERGEIAGVLAFSMDITDRKRLEETVGRIANEWQTTFDAIRNPVLLLSPDLRVVRANAAAAAFLERPAKQVPGSPYGALFALAGEGGVPAPLSAALVSKVHQEQEVEDRSRGAWFLLTADPVLDPAGQLLGLVHTVIDITPRKMIEAQLQHALEEGKDLRDSLREENVQLRREVKKLSRFTDIVGQSQAFQQVHHLAEQVAPADTTVLLLGETGTGKEMLAKFIHQLSPRRNRPMVSVNCAALPSTLIESELFGREKGAYTGALSQQLGRFEMANGSTLFLDEIGDLGPELQVKLLRALAEKRIERLGGSRSIAVNARVVAATHRDLEQAMREGQFRQDLYYRLNVFPIHLPPLRERREDIPLLVWAFVDEFGKAMGKTVRTVDENDMEALMRYPWPGNIRELKNLVERAMIVAPGPRLRIEAPKMPEEALPVSRQMQDVERTHILHVLESARWRISGRGGAADLLGMKPSTLRSRMQKLGLRRS